jgi:hypothetical protein
MAMDVATARKKAAQERATRLWLLRFSMKCYSVAFELRDQDNRFF